MSLLLFVLTGAAVAASRPPDKASSIPTRQVSAWVGRYADWIVRNELRSAHEAIFCHVSDLDIDEHYPQLVQDNCVAAALNGLHTALGTCLAEAKSHNFVKAALGENHRRQLLWPWRGCSEHRISGDTRMNLAIARTMFRPQGPIDA